MSQRHPTLPALTLLALAACSPARGTTRAPAPPAGTPRAPALSAAAEVGHRIFFDRSLSASGQMSCATCHDPDHAYGPPNNLAVQLGGPRGDQAGLRAVPSLRYKEATPAYADLLDNPDGVSAPGPGGGFAWDGRADTLAQQARLPLLSPIEMANASPAEVARKIQAAPYAADFARAFGDDTTADTVFENALRALEAFQKEDPSFHPYTSKFDLHAGNKIGGTWTAAEARGVRVFVSPQLGNCGSCHYSGPGLNGSSGMFSDYSYEAIGVPRNAALPANADPKFTDLGLCGPLRTDHGAAGAAPNRFCGMFKTPTLRNVAQRRVFFHNGAMRSLEQVIRFYNTRDTNPELWYPTVGGRAEAKPDARFPTYGLVTTQYAGGQVAKYDDLPEAYRANIDPQMPLDGRRAGSKPPLSERDISDLICFLETLTDGYRIPAAPPTSGRCVD
ncbi:MAG TPA: cytochrome c peroxidase [Polyangia bacterium]|nr:cytochrome c peroxidase [Polyangia bacterium]